MVKGARSHEEEESTRELRDGHNPEGGGVTGEFADDTAAEHTETDADIPRDEQRGVGGATLVVVGHGDNHVLEGRPEVAVAEAQQKRRAIVADLVGEEDEERVGHRGDDDALGGIQQQLALAQGTGPLQTGGDKPQGEEQEPGACAAGDAHHLLAVDGEVVAHHAETETEEDHVDGQQPASDEEETVEADEPTACWLLAVSRWLLGGGERFCLDLHLAVNNHAYAGNEQRQPEQQLEIARQPIEIDGSHGGSGHRQVIGKAVVADALIAPRRRQHIDGHRGIGNGQRSEGGTVQCPHDGEEQQRRGSQITAEKEEEEEETHHQHPLAGEAVHQIAAERARQQGRQRVAAQHESHHILRGIKALHEIQRQQGCQQIEGEEQSEIRPHHATVVAVPKSFLHHGMGPPGSPTGHYV